MELKLNKFVFLTVSLFLFWILLTSSFSPIELIIGIFVSVFISYLSIMLLRKEMNSVSINYRQLGRLILYIPYLLKEIIKANIDVAERVLSPELPISPKIIQFRFPLKTPISQTTMANSITLTPGTLTVDIDKEGVFYVHCLAEDHVESLLKGELRRHVLRVYKEKEK
ncbi:MAG: Na+/H+ antiporter subunit E [Actinomycetia bacterium]|nr:Na+/H+ antiporter subunit E [Actinomycetes bacterium]